MWNLQVILETTEEARGVRGKKDVHEGGGTEKRGRSQQMRNGEGWEKMFLSIIFYLKGDTLSFCREPRLKRDMLTPIKRAVHMQKNSASLVIQV